MPLRCWFFKARARRHGKLDETVASITPLNSRASRGDERKKEKLHNPFSLGEIPRISGSQETSD